ncbi:glycoside hydrolase family 38 C-terminal domain-containing protein [Oscillatoria laete-virens NRMC-F 0139]|nr:alpha-mannosidase [Oscillatoria laete-virens]MDL5054772.1 glycoside hydrolase family 38 C-terminal domain-containing protein [Oscillatoria laete-virens NRMC-F 0139]
MKSPRFTADIHSSFRHGLVHLESLKMRGCAQLDFAGVLCELNARRAEAWGKLRARGSATLSKGLASGSVEKAAKAIRELEEILAPLHAEAKSHTIHAVGHAHIDMTWIFSWQETVATTCDTMTTVLKLMEEFPEFKFSQDQAAIYRILEEYQPELLDMIRAQIARGHWEAAATHWVEADKNMVTGESLIRQIAEARESMRGLFGLKADDLALQWNPDTFGHCADYPAILAGAGIKYYFFARPGGGGFHNAKEYPPLFRWQARDGSEVMAFWCFNGYNGLMRPQMATEAHAQFARRSGLKDFLYCHGIGDHGGGPTRQDLLYAREMAAWPCFPTIKHTTAREYFELMEKYRGKLPVVSGELNHEMEGCYTSAALIKKCNRIAENLTLDTETISSLADALKIKAYPADKMRTAWRETLFAHFHDILPGSGIPDTRNYMHGKWQDNLASLGQIETQALRAWAAQIDTSAIRPEPQPDLPASHLPTSLGSGSGRRALLTGTSLAGDGMHNGGASVMDTAGEQGSVKPYVIFNPLARPRESIQTLVLWDYAPGKYHGETRIGSNRLKETPFAVEIPGGPLIKAQLVEQGNFWFHDYAVLAFPAGKISALGYRVIATHEKEADIPENFAGATCSHIRWGHGSSFALENDRVQYTFDPDTGFISSITDKKSGIDLTPDKDFGLVLEYALERHNHRATAWVYGEGEIEKCPPKLVSFKPTAEGPYIACFEAEYTVKSSRVKIVYELRAGSPRLSIRMDIKWLEIGSPESGVPQLRLKLPIDYTKPTVTCEIPTGTLGPKPPAPQEFAALTWARVEGTRGKTKAGLLLINEGKHGHKLTDEALTVTLIRSSYDPDPIPEVGEHRILLALVPFTGDLGDADSQHEANCFLRPVRVIPTTIHCGPLPPELQTIGVKAKRTVVSAFKKADNGKGFILRLNNLSDSDERVTLTCDPRVFGKKCLVTECDLLEQPVGKPEPAQKPLLVHARTYVTLLLSPQT